MQTITTLTQKGQITLPKKIREKAGLKPYNKVYLEASADSVKITPTYDILDIAGKFTPKKKKSILSARARLDKSYKRV
ncbi:MAG: AbrB/MazE/SpoVT family DNA-binding domain-containing protein [Microgenomates group bacterium]